MKNKINVSVGKQSSHKSNHKSNGAKNSGHSNGNKASKNKSKQTKNVKTQTKIDDQFQEPVLNDENVIQYHVTRTNTVTDHETNTSFQNNEPYVNSSGAMQFHNMITAKFAHLKTQCLVDSGASINVISTKFLSQIPSKFVTKLPTKISTVIGVGDYQTKIKSRVRLNFKIDGVIFTEDFYTLHNNYNVILGLPFMENNNAILNISQAEISLNGSKFNLQTPAIRSTMARTCHNEIIEAYTVSEINIKLAKPVTTPMMLLSGISSVERKYPGLTVVEAVIDSAHTRVRLVNKSEEPVTISKNSPICLARTIHQSEITEFIDFFEPCDDIDDSTNHNDDSTNQNFSDTVCEPSVSGNASPVCCMHTASNETPPIHRPQHLHDLDPGSLPSTPAGSNGNHHNTPQACLTGNQLSVNEISHQLSSQNVLETHGDNKSVNHESENADSNQTFSMNSNHKPKSKVSQYKCYKNQNTADNTKTNIQHSQNKTTDTDDADPYDKKLEFQIGKDNFSHDEKDDFKQFLLKNHKVFATSRKNMGHNAMYPHITDTGDGKSFGFRYYKTSPRMQKILDDEIQDLLEHGFIEPSTSAWRSPAILVRKQSTTGEPAYRLVCDYRKLNKLSVPQHFPMITVEEVWEMVGRTKPKIFSSLDLASGYHQLSMDEESKHKASFVVRGQQYTWNRLPFGLKNAPITFAKTMHAVLKDLLFKTVILYVDDILVMSDCIECHKQHLQEVFDRLAKANLTLKASKCKFAVEEIKFLGHILNSQGVSPNPAKLEIVANYKQPKNEKQVRQFLGLSQYYKRFQKDYSKTAKPLYDLTKKDTPWNWTPECQQAFAKLKDNLTNPPVLAYPDNTKDYIIDSDASTNGLGYVLAQKHGNFERVVAYSGRALRKSEKNYTISELEALAVVSAFKQFHSYVYGNFTTVRTDHSALKYIQNPSSKAVGKIARWMLELQNYDFVIEYKPGKLNSAADALSRLTEYPKSTEDQAQIPGDPIIMPAVTPPFQTPEHDPHMSTADPLQKCDWLEAPLFDEFDEENIHEYCFGFDIKNFDIRTAQQNCEEIGPWYRFIKSGTVPPEVEYSKAYLATADQYAIKDGILIHMFQPRTRNIHQYHPIITQVVVPKNLRARILSEYHESLVGGAHVAFDKVFQAIRQKYYWPKMYSEIYEYQQSCIKCQRASTHKPKRPPLQPLPIVGLFERISLDFIGPLRESNSKKRWILLVVDSFSHWCEAFAMETADAISTAKVLYSEILTRYGAPRYILTDRGAKFLSSLVQALCEIFSIKRLKSTPYHPCTNVTCERFNCFINKSLRTMVDDSQQDWPLVLPAIMMAYRSTPGTHSTEVSPYFLCFGKQMITPIDTVINPNITEVSPNYRETLKLFIDNIKIARQVAAENLLRHQEYNKMYYDKNSAIPNYKVGDLVWLWDPTTPVGYSKKLKARWVGPYRIAEIGPHHTYRLRHYQTDLPTDTMINAQRLKPAKLPWESKIRTEDPDNQRVNVPEMRNVNNEQKQRDTQNAKLVNKPTGTDKPYHITKRGEIKASAPTSLTKTPQRKQLKVVKVVNLKKQNKEKWFRVKFENDRKTYWIKEGTMEIPQHLVDQCLKIRTWQGKPRKRKW